MSFQSRYDGKCKTCKKEYVAGTIIYKINEEYWCSDEKCGSHSGYTTPSITPRATGLEIATPPAQLWEELKRDEEKEAHAAAYSDYDVEAVQEQEKEDTTTLVGQMSQDDWQKLKKQAQKTQEDAGNDLSKITKRLTVNANLDDDTVKYVSRLHDQMWDLATIKIRDLNIPDSEKVSKSILTQVFYKKMMDAAIHRRSGEED